MVEEGMMDGSIVKGLGISGPILNSLRDQICLLDKQGTIIFVNEEWTRFASNNGGESSSTGPGVNYLEVCEKDSPIYNGLKTMLAGKLSYFDHEYPCHSPTKRGAGFSNETSLSYMLNKADEALYTAKNRGKNQVVIA